MARLFSPPHECRGQQRGRQGGHRASRLSAPVQHLGPRSTWLLVDSNSRNSRSGLSVGNPRTQIAWRCYEMRDALPRRTRYATHTRPSRSSSGIHDGDGYRALIVSMPEVDRVRAAHRRMIGIDPDRDACAVTVVTRPQPRACRLSDPPQHHPMFERCTTDDHAPDREAVTERAGDKCMDEPGAQPESRPKPAHRRVEVARRALTQASTGPRSFCDGGHWRGEHADDVSGTLSSCGTRRKL